MSPPRSTRYALAPCARSSAGEATRFATEPRRPIVYTGSCSSSRSRSGPPARTRVAIASWSRHPSTYPTRPSHVATSSLDIHAPLRDQTHVTLSVIRGTHQRSRLDVRVAHRHPGVAEPRELVGRPVALDREVHGRGSQVLADREHVGALRADVTHRRDHLVLALAEADHDPGLAHEIRGALLGAPQDLERSLVDRLRPHAPVQAR